MKTAMIKNLILASSLVASTAHAESSVKAQPSTVPAVKEWNAQQGTMNVLAISQVVVVGENAQLSTLAKLVSEELKLTTKNVAGGVKVGLKIDTSISKNAEAYELTIGDQSISITGASPAGVYYGTRTLQQMLQQSAELPKGTIKDAPLYPVRSVLLDVGRKFMPVDEVKDWIRMMGWMKLNELHFHLNDNSWGRYPGYRLESKKFPGLASKDGHYTFEQIRELQDFAKIHGVVIMPELDTPGHSLAITHYRPELAHPEINREGFGLAYLDLNNPDATQFVKDLWDEVIPLFDSETVHIGTDEYRYRLVKGKEAQEQIGEKFRQYINEMAVYIEKKHGKTVRMWSGFEHLPGTTQPNKSIVIDMWETSDAKDKVNAGYKVVNSSHFYTYIVPGAPYYGVNNAFIYNDWTPMQFSGEPSGQLSPEDPGLMGGKLHVWNDYGPTGYTWNEIARLSAPSMAAMSEKLWGVKGAENYQAFNTYAASLSSNIPNVKLTSRKAVKPDSDFVWELKKPTIHIANTNPELNLAAENLEYPWTASFTVTRHNDIAGDEALISSDLAMFYLDLTHSTEDKKTKKTTTQRGVACVRANQGAGWEPLLSYNPDVLFFDYELPLNQKVKLTFVGEQKRTSLYVDGKLVGSVNKQMVCPLTRLGHPLTHGFHGTLHAASIKSTAPYSAEVAQWSPATVSEQKQPTTVDVTKHITTAGAQQVVFQYQSGGNRLDIHQVELLENGKVVATDTHLGFTGGQSKDNTYSLQLKKLDKQATYTIRYAANTDGGTDSTGSITLNHLDF